MLTTCWPAQPGLQVEAPQPGPAAPHRCNLGEDVADALAANVRLRLADYLRLG